MNVIRNTFGFIFVVLNLLVGMGLLVGAYGQYLSPVLSPILSISGLGFPIFVVLNLLFFFFWVFVRPKYALLPVILFVCCIDALLTYCPMSFSKDQKDGCLLKVLTYNVMGMPSEKGPKGEKVYPALEYVRKSGADIVCMQEFPANHSDLVKRLKPV